jgi:predicted nucleic acid-binding protein
VVDLSPFDLVIGRSFETVAEWFEPVLQRGRQAAFVDTGFLRALIVDDDQFATEARPHFQAAQQTRFYTTNLVLAETVRQLAKDSASDYPTKSRRFGTCTELVIGAAPIWVCAPPRDVVLAAYTELLSLRIVVPDLDLTDCLSLAVLKYAEHRRVFGFDSHFRVFGAALEPRP